MIFCFSVETRYCGPTNHQDARISVVLRNGKTILRRLVVWDHALNPDENHWAAARVVAESQGMEILSASGTERGYVYHVRRSKGAP